MVNKEGEYNINLEDDVIERSIITHEGKKLWPCEKPLPMLDAGKKKDVKKEEKKEEVVDPWKATLKSAIGWAVGLSSIVGMGVLCPDPAFLGMMTTFGLAVVTGY